MRWYSVKKYTPIEGVQLVLFRDENGEPRLDIGHYLHGEFLYLDNIRIPGVTHFCIPDPIEIENDINL